MIINNSFNAKLVKWNFETTFLMMKQNSFCEKDIFTKIPLRQIQF
jgi:hypothetical protein